MLVKKFTRIRVSNLVIIFFNGVGMGDHKNKYILRPKKSLRAKRDIHKKLEAFIHFIP